VLRFLFFETNATMAFIFVLSFSSSLL